MLAHTRLLFGAVLAFAACSATMATAAEVGVDASRATRVTAEQLVHRKLLIERPAAVSPKSGNSVASATPGLPRMNPIAAYPPSCLADPLPDIVSGPSYNRNVTLAAYNGNTAQVDSTEIVTITIWRVACSSSQYFTSATLMRIKRSSNSQVVYPLFPAIRVSQGAIGFGDSAYPANIARVTIEPNTILADTMVDTPILNDMTFVLENYDSTQTSVFDFNLPFSLRFDNLFATNNQFFIDVPSYSPNTGTYPDAFRNLPISGYLSSNWYDPAANGEGIILQIYERVNEPQTLVVAFSWAAFDPSGVPFWLFGQADIARGSRSATVPIVYLTGGGLGGNAGSAATAHPWGSVTIGFPSCNEMSFNYASSPGLPTGVPTGTGIRTWQRPANVNGLFCE
ncbi:MAG: hypothetical protein ABI127_04095 [Dokdonella sp.]